MDIDELLTTTRSVRKRLDLDKPVPRAVLEECLEIALQAPTGSNLQGWHFLFLTEEEPKRVVADAYRKAFNIYKGQAKPDFGGDDPRTAQLPKVVDSAVYLAENMHRAPALLLACIQGRCETQPPLAQASVYGSILPAAWSFMLALRARGLGSAWTTLHIMFEQEVAQALGIPADVTQAVLLPIAYTLGTDFKPAKRLPLAQVTSWNHWGNS